VKTGGGPTSSGEAKRWLLFCEIRMRAMPETCFCFSRSE